MVYIYGMYVTNSLGSNVSFTADIMDILGTGYRILT